MKFTFSAFLLASLMAASPEVTTAKTESRSMTRGVSSAPIRLSQPLPPRFLSNDGDSAEGASMEQSGTGASEDGSSSDESAFSRGPSERECDMSYEDDEAEFECKAETRTADGGEIEDKIKFKIKAKKEKALKISVEYETETETEDVESETETKYTVVFDRLLEYRKAGASQAISRSNPEEPGLETQDVSNQVFKWGEDEVVAEWPMEEWSDFSPLETDGSMMKFSASSLNGLAGFTFTIHEVGDGMDITANNMKIDFLLEGYPWAASGDTFVALVCHVETEREVEIESDGDDEAQAMDVLISFGEAVESTGLTPFGQYTWANYAVASSFSDAENSTAAEGDAVRYLEEEATIPVVATTSPRTASESDPSTTFNEIAFSFVGQGQGAQRIYWDPEAGVGYDDTGANGGSSGGSSSAAFGGVSAYGAASALAMAAGTVFAALLV